MRSMLTPDHFNRESAGKLPGFIGIRVTHVGVGELRAELTIRESLMAVNGFLHAGTVVTLADTSAGFGCLANLPDGATGFTT
ncbi:MAG: PaaI family thioesterase, partial [Gemmatimonadaceae bacterium]